MDTSKLRPDTARVWAALADEPLLRGFVLIGGTALTLRIQHRISEDLDFLFGDVSLPRERLRQLARRMHDRGLNMQLNQHPADVADFIDAGLKLDDHQQNFLVADSVKVSFSTFDAPLRSLVPQAADAPLRIATLDELFASKSLVTAERIKSRDWFDLYVLMTRHGYSALDLHDAFTRSGNLLSLSLAEANLRACKARDSDEGYQQLIDEAPSADTLRSFFNDAFDALQATLAKRAFLAQAASKLG
jgi:predicted nucleotidyltransferase component of viral defense system